MLVYGNRKRDKNGVSFQKIVLLKRISHSIYGSEKYLILAVQGIEWESEEAVQYADALYEQINYLTIQASMELAKEKGAYPVLEGSDWHSGRYFADRGHA